MNGGGTTWRRIGSAALMLPAAGVVGLAVGVRVTGNSLVAPGVAVSLAAAAVIVVVAIASALLRRAVQVVTIVVTSGLLIDAGWPPVDVVATLIGLAIITVVADRLGAELEVLRAQHERERRQLERRVSLLSAVEALPDTHDEAIAEVVATVRSLAFDMAGVAFVRDGMLVGELLDGVADLPPLPPGRGLAWRSIREDRTVTTLDYITEPDRLHEHPRVGPVVVVPIRVDGRPVGALMGARYTDTELTEVEIEVAEVLAAHLGSVLTALERERRQSELLARASRLDDLRSSLIAAVSEEVRTPIAAVAAAAEQLRPAAAVTSDSDAHTAAALAHLRASAAELHTTVTTVLAVARRRLTGDAGEFEVLTLGELVARVTRVPDPHVAARAADAVAARAADAVAARAADAVAAPTQRVDALGWDQRVEVVPGLVAHAIELLIGREAPASLAIEDVEVVGTDAGPTLAVQPGRAAVPSPVVRSLAAQLLAAAGAELVGVEGVVIRFQPAPVGQLG